MFNIPPLAHSSKSYRYHYDSSRSSTNSVRSRTPVLSRSFSTTFNIARSRAGPRSFPHGFPIQNRRSTSTHISSRRVSCTYRIRLCLLMKPTTDIPVSFGSLCGKYGFFDGQSNIIAFIYILLKTD